MRHLMILLGLIIFPFFGNSQNYEQFEAEREVHSEMISENVYRVSFVYENSEQRGIYVKVKEGIVKHGVWRMTIYGKTVMKVKYDMGNMVLLTTYGPEGKKEYDNTTFEIQRLKNKINRLENELAEVVVCEH